MKKYLLIFAVVVAVLVLTLPNANTVEASGDPTYTISPDDNTYNNNMMNYSTYNNDTEDYYLIRSYLEQLEKTEGGTLILQEGTYTISNVLYVPSNVTIKLEDGVRLEKGTETGTSKFGASKSMFQLIRPSRAKDEGVYGGYEGEKNITIVGSGTAVIDLNYVKYSKGIIAGHNQNITIKNISFQNMYSGHFIEMDATKNALISNNEFTGSKPSANINKEAINLDTPDKATEGWSSKWSTFDKTPNENVTIENNSFYNLDRAIGTHKYSGGKYHDHIVIRNNTIEKTRSDAIRVMNWSNAVIENNTIKNVAPSPDNNNRGILVSGAINPTFQNNVFVSVPRAMQFMVWKNSGPGSEYAITYNELSDENIKALQTNTVIDYEEDFIRINKEYQKYDREHTDYIYVNTAIFSDLMEGESGYEETMELVNNNIINGYPDFTFKPYQSISRAHVAVLLARTFGLKPTNSVEETLGAYEDVSEDHLYAEQIAAVTEANIFNGSDNQFNPDDEITRSQMATVLVRAFELKGNDTTVDLTDMEKIDVSHRGNVMILAQNNITIGKPGSNGDRYFDGFSDLKRVQFAIFLHRTMELKGL